jgi:hypothetical protein
MPVIDLSWRMWWESLTAVILLLGFWANSLWTLQTVHSNWPYWWWHDLLRALPWLVLCPVFAVSGLRHPRASQTSRATSRVVLGLWLFSPQTWIVLGYLLRLVEW